VKQVRSHGPARFLKGTYLALYPSAKGLHHLEIKKNAQRRPWNMPRDPRSKGLGRTAALISLPQSRLARSCMGHVAIGSRAEILFGDLYKFGEASLDS
jgi:hypothetical protein